MKNKTDWKNIEDAISILKELQKIKTEFPIQYAVCLLQIYQNEGLSLSELSNQTCIALSTVSRITTKLASSKTPDCYGLVTVKINPEEKRKKQIFLTSDGSHVVQNLSKIISEIKQKKD